MITTTISTTDYLAVLTTESFLDGAAWNRSLVASDEYNLDKISELQDNAGMLTRLEIADCIRNYDDEFVSDWRNVIVVTNATAKYGAVLDVDPNGIHQGRRDDPNWYCSWKSLNRSAEYGGGSSDCGTDQIIKTGQWYVRS